MPHLLNLTQSPEYLVGSYRVVCHSLSDGIIYRHACVLKTYKVMETSIKPHACCRYKQGPIDGILELVRENDLKPSDIEKVRLGILKVGFPIVAQPEEQKRNPILI